MVTAAQIQFRDEFIASFERRQSVLRDTVTTEAVIKGNQATFLVSGSGGARASRRGANGYIPARQNDNTQITVTLEEAHDLVRHTNFDIFASQGDQRRIMQENAMAVINRDIDDVIIDALEAGTLTNTTAEVASFDALEQAKQVLYENNIPLDRDLYALITPAFQRQLNKIKEYASADYVNTKPLVAGGNEAGGAFRPKFWNDVNWIVSTAVTGVGTSSSTCLFYHKSAIGHAINKDDKSIKMGVDEEQAYQWVRCSVDHGSKLIQNNGIYKFLHNDTA